jgi:hypothetical protein
LELVSLQLIANLDPARRLNLGCFYALSDLKLQAAYPGKKDSYESDSAHKPNSIRQKFDHPAAFAARCTA